MNIHDLPVVETIAIRPHAGKVTDALSRIGYKIEEAIADLLDNAIDAIATKVLIRFVHDGTEIRRIIIADNGRGMSKAQLLVAMQFGTSRDRDSAELGKFGMGLKTAALSQGRSLTVVSRQSGHVGACRWTTQSIASGWNCEVLAATEATRWLDNIRQPFVIGDSGTLIVIDELDHIRAGGKGLEATLQKLHKKLSVHLGLVFHRFLGDRLSLYIDASSLTGDVGFSVPVEALGPFDYAISGDASYPLDFSLRLQGLPELQCQAHIWPPNQATSGYLLSGGNVARRQGFYFYRNGRLIQSGGWNGWRPNETEHHFSLARVAIELTPDFDAEFRLNVQKSALDVPEQFRAALDAAGCPMGRYIRRAEEVYRKKIDVEEDFIPVPGKGFGGAVRRRAASYLAGRKAPKHDINVLWRNLAADRFFVIDRDDGNIILNKLYREDVLCGLPSTLNDAPVVKILLFMLLRDDLLRERESKRFMERLEEINELLMLAVREQQNRQS
jgi:hypothetical protein